MWTCYLYTRPVLLYLFVAVHSNGNMSDFTRYIISGNYEAVISTSLFPLRLVCLRQRSCFHADQPRSQETASCCSPCYSDHTHSQ